VVRDETHPTAMESYPTASLSMPCREEPSTAYKSSFYQVVVAQSF
jgi:hypothetical protein